MPSITLDKIFFTLPFGGEGDSLKRKPVNEMHLVGDDVDLDVHADVDVDVYDRGQLVQ